MYRRLKNNHFRELLNGCRHSPKIDGTPSITLQVVNVNKVLRQYHSHIVSHFSTLFHYPWSPCELLCGPDNVTTLCSFQPVTKHDVERTLLSFASSKSPGICSSELKLAGKTISGMLTILFNESLATGEVPQDSKLGNIIPLPKPGKKDTTSSANYWGITLNSILAREKKLFTAVVFMDLSKAFDNVHHQTLLIMLQRYQIGGTVLKWLYNYLQGRNQRILLATRYLNHSIQLRAASLGNFCLMSVSDLAAIANQDGTSLPLFVDDMSMFCSCSTLEEACRVVSRAMSIFNEAISSRGLAMIHDKTVSMIIMSCILRGLVCVFWRLSSTGDRVQWSLCHSDQQFSTSWCHCGR